MEKATWGTALAWVSSPLQACLQRSRILAFSAHNDLQRKEGQQPVTVSDTSKNTQTERELAVDQAATYSIQVVGHLDEYWSARLGGLTISSSSQAGRKTVTTLSGTIIDQAALFGVLKALYDMRLPLLSVECLDINEGVKL